MAGGRNPIVGLLYELAIAGESVLVSEGVVAEDASDVLSVSMNCQMRGKDKAILFQYLDTDLSLVGADDIVIIQCKASEVVDRIGIRDFERIIVDAAKQLRKIRIGEPERKLGAFVLATNRPFTEKAETLAAKEGLFQAGETSQSIVPDCLGAMTVRDWTVKLKDRSKQTGRQPAPSIPPDLAVLAAEILLSYRFAPIKLSACEQAFEKAMCTFGLWLFEIKYLVHSIAGAVIEGAGQGDCDVREIVRSKIMKTGPLRSLCPGSIASIASRLLDEARRRSDFGPFDQSTQTGLPRRRLVQACIEAVQVAESNSQFQVVLLNGHGGMGKTWLLFEAVRQLSRSPQGSAPMRIFLRGSNQPRELVHDAVAPFFADYRVVQYGNGEELLRRLSFALENCGSTPSTWIAVPHSDELPPEQLEELLEYVSSRSIQARFLLTARDRNLPNNPRLTEGPWLAKVSVDELEREELYEWFNAQGVTPRTERTSHLLLREGANYVSRASGGDAVRRGTLDHPLAFRALNEWLKPMDPIARVNNLQSFLGENQNEILGFMSYFREALCARVSKHCQVSLEEVELAFDLMSKQRADLPTMMPGEWTDRIRKNLEDGRQADNLMRHFLQVGIVRRKADAGALVWGVPYIEQGVDA